MVLQVAEVLMAEDGVRRATMMLFGAIAACPHHGGVHRYVGGYYPRQVSSVSVAVSRPARACPIVRLLAFLLLALYHSSYLSSPNAHAADWAYAVAHDILSI